MSGKFPGHNTRSGWTAYPAGGITLAENRSFPGDLVNVWGFVILTTQHAQIVDAQVISQYKYYIGLCRAFHRSRILACAGKNQSTYPYNRTTRVPKWSVIHQTFSGTSNPFRYSRVRY